MKKLISLVAAIVAIAAVSGCTKSAPSCSDPKTVELVKQIARKKLDSRTPGASEKTTIELDSITTTAKDDKTGAQSCKANITFKIPEMKFETSDSIIYISEYTDNKEHLVSVKGL